MRKRPWTFLFPPDSGQWLSLLRVGLGCQVILYTWSLRHDWRFLFQSDRQGSVVRTLTEAIVSSQTELTPRLGWILAIGERLGGTESVILWVIWFSIIVAGCLLLLGF